ncbi:MAG: RNA polymerase-binding protein DksA [bacterium]|jgi:DnaK suppressor protein
MQDADLAYFRERLMEMRQELLGESEETVHELREENALFPDPNDRASMESDNINTLRIRDRERKLLAKVDEAIERLEEGSFGICEECGEEIGVERLKIRPVTTYCIVCKEEQEAEERRG